MHTLQLGKIRIDRVVESEGPFAALDFLLPEIDDQVLIEHGSWLKPNFVSPVDDRVIMSFHSFVVRTENLNILVDTCVGNDKERPARPGWHRQRSDYVHRLAQAGLTPDDVDVVMCTHLHADHVGWNTCLENGRWVPTFRNARYLFARDEYEFWRGEVAAQDPDNPVNHGAFEDSVLPIVEAGRAEFITDGFDVDHGCRVEAAPGHTPGNVVILLADGRHQALMTGDVLHTAVQLARPTLSSRFCADPVQSALTRTALLERLVETGMTMLPAHFPAPVAGRVISVGDSFRYQT